MGLRSRLLLGMFVGLGFWQCQMDAVRNENDQLLAEVHGKTLYISELEGMVPDNVSPEDSALLINAFVERWVREAVLLHEAELNVPKDLNIDKLVRDYRSTLLKNNYEQILVKELLDSTIQKQELTSFYEATKDQFILEEPILKCYFIKVPVTAPDLDELKKWWNKMDSEQNRVSIQAYAANFALASHLNDSLWFEVKEIGSEMPSGWLTASNLASKNEFVQTADSVRYFFRRLEVVPAQSIPPFEFVLPKIKRLILHQRKQKLLEQKKEEMYQRELRLNNIHIFR